MSSEQRVVYGGLELPIALCGEFNAWSRHFEGVDMPRYAFVVEASASSLVALLFALWTRGCTPILLSDEKALHSIDCSGSLVLANGGVTRHHGEALLDLAGAELAFLTSGSTGEPKIVGKSLPVLLREADVLEQSLGRYVDGALVIPTVSHQHIYGFLFLILWPPVAKRPLPTRRCFFPEEIEDAMSDAHTICFVSSPAHIRFLEQLVVREGSCERRLRLLSSGGAMPTAVAARLAGKGMVLVEIYGSTETGGIAFRDWSTSAVLWQPLADVLWRIEDEALWVQSGRTSPPGAWVQTGDRAKIVGMGFELLGRLDTLVKVSEKRISLTGIERKCCELDGVLVARCFMMPKNDEGRDELGLLLVLDQGGWTHLAKRGRSALVKEVRSFLAQHFESVAVPKRVHFVRALPQNSQGKTTRGDMLQMLQTVDIYGVVGRIIAQTDGEIALQMRITADHDGFKGHFPGAPVFPGVCQLLLAEGAVRAIFDGGFAPSSLQSVKFQSIMRPDTDIVLTIVRKAKAYGFKIVDMATEKPYSSGRLML